MGALQTPEKGRTACATPPPAPARKAWRDVAARAAPITPPPIPPGASINVVGRSPRTPASLSTPSPSRLERFSPGQEPDSAKYLARLFRLARRLSTRTPAPESPCARRGSAPRTGMADFLASFNLGGDSGPPIDSDKYGSVDELALHLRGLLEQKTTETRAEHVAVTLELRPTVQFHLSLTESENEALEGLNSMDPSMGGSRSASMSIDPAGQAMRSVSGNDTLMNQSDNPILQRTVAKHIIGVLGTMDHTNWTLRDLSRGQQGWTFTYICKDSLQHWNRQYAKNPSDSVIGEYSQTEPDEILMNRPAFDCRGSVTIAFNRSSRSISVKYDHTLLHKTVQQLSQEYKPPPRELGIGYQRQQELKQQQKTPKKSKREEKRERKRKEREEKAAEKAAEGEQGVAGERPAKRKKRPSKKKAQDAQDGPVMPPDPPGAQPVDGPSQSYATAQTGPVIAFSITPEEASRRQLAARTLLSESGVNPDTLSVDQMNIFSNQSPELQRDSVAMLAKYGAERLQIIHPSNKDKSGSSNPPEQTTQATPSGPMTTKELAPETTKSGRKKKPTAKAAVEDNATGTPSKPAKKMGKSRVACFSCKSRKVKCPKERPACSECASHNQSCEYPPQKPRNRNRKSETVVIDDDEEEQEEAEEDVEDETEVQRPQQQSEAYYDGVQHSDLSQMGHADMSYSNNMPVADMLTPSTEALHQAGNDTSYFQSGPGLALPQPPGPHQTTQHPSGLALPQAQPQNVQESHMATSSNGTKAKSPKQKRKSKTTTAAARHSLPTGIPGEATISDQNMNTAAPQSAAASWVATHTQPSNHNSAMPSGLAQQAARNQRSQQAGRRMPTDSPQMNDSVTQPANNVQQARQQVPQAQQSPRMLAALQAQARTSPLQAVQQRTDSRQSHRGQSRTPNADQNVTRGYKPPPQGSGDLVASSNHGNHGRYATGNAPAGDANNRIAYEPYSWQQSSASVSNSYPAFDYNRNTSSSMSMNNPSTMAPSYNSTTATSNQWSGSQSRSTRAQDRTAGYGNTGSYQQNASNPASLQNFDMRGSAQKRVNSGSINKQGYSQYDSQQSQEHQMGQPGWNNFNYTGGNQFGSSGSGWM